MNGYIVINVLEVKEREEKKNQQENSDALTRKPMPFI